MTTGPRLVGTALNAAALPAPRLAGRAAYELFRSTRGRSPIRPEEAEVDRRATLHYLVVNGRDVATYRWGDGAVPVLLVHGWQSRASRFAALVTALLEHGYSPVGYDAPGHGDSAGRTTTILEHREIIRRLGEEFGSFRAVVAHSFGVPAAFLALRTVLKADQLVALAGVCDLEFTVRSFSAGLRLNERLVRELTARLENNLLPGESDIWRRFSATYRPEEVTLPILLVHDADDRQVPISQSQRLAAGYPGQSRLITTHGLGHGRVLSAPEVIRSTLDFLRLPPQG